MKGKSLKLRSLELIQREQAFRLYKKYRDLKKIAEYPGMPDISILKIWKEEDNWDERLADIEERLKIWDSFLKKMEEDSILRDDVFYLLLLNKLMETTIRAIIERNLEPTSWKEAIDTIKFIYEQKRLLLGRPQIKAEVDLTGMSEEELRENLKQIYNLLNSSLQTKELIDSEITQALEYHQNNQKEEKEERKSSSNFLADIDE